MMLTVVLFVGCLVAWAAAANFGQFIEKAVWAAVSADVFVLAAADAVALAAAVLTSWACGAVTACLPVDPGQWICCCAAWGMWLSKCLLKVLL